MRPIDLLPDLKIRRKEQLVSSLPRLLLVAVLLWALTLGGVYFWIHTQKQAVQALFSGVQEQVQALEPVAQRVQQVALLNGKVQELRNLLQDNTAEQMVPALDLLASLLPSQIEAQQIGISEDRVTVSCRSSQLTPIGRLQQNLAQTAGIEDVQLTLISGFEETVGEAELQSVVTGYTFSLSFIYKGAK